MIFFQKHFENLKIDPIFASANEREAYLNTEEWQSWFNALVLKTSVREIVPGVRIPLSPQIL